ncbi:unnamed protein product [Periconia digitata]|uniref:Uncharacterized protein n=1 Tax=Periconia digitata TaxID=1303443 RepID=A0A9W4U9P0_9PLEO|nr:unnamed protein product [Periconia digitata]
MYNACTCFKPPAHVPRIINSSSFPREYHQHSRVCLPEQPSPFQSIATVSPIGLPRPTAKVGSFPLPLRRASLRIPSNSVDTRYKSWINRESRGGLVATLCLGRQRCGRRIRFQIR